MSASFVDTSGQVTPSLQGWKPIVVRKAEIDREIDRLIAQPQPAHGIRSSRIVHPQSVAPGLGMTPGIDITISVLLPGETTQPVRHNSTQVSICIRGRGQATIGARSFAFERLDVWNTPGMHPYVYRNTGDAPMVRLSYSNAALLEKLLTHYVEVLPDDGPRLSEIAPERTETIERAKALAKPIPIGDAGAQLLTYEHLISPEVVPNAALHWPWKEIETHRDVVFPMEARGNLGRRGLFVLYNPATGRSIGATHSFFATIGFMPPNVLDFPHRHSSNAINYCLEGAFVSEVDGQRVQWSEGDIAYTAPGWSAHANGSEATGGTALTIQDHPFQIATESLIWQEGEGKPIVLLGAQQGFESDDSVVLSAASR